MDERRLAEMLRDAVADTPPPSFDERDVARESERQRIRRRNGILTGSAFGVVILASATALGVALWTGPHSAEQTNDADTAAAGGNATAAPYELPQEDSADAPKAERENVPENAPSEKRKQGRPPSGDAGSSDPGSTPSGCEKADRELAAALAGELPAAANVTTGDAQSVELTCPNGSIGAMYRVVDSGQSGSFSAVVVQPDITPPEWRNVPIGTQRGEASMDDGRTVIVLSEPRMDGDFAPFGNDVQQVANGIARDL
ncbi:MAG TPA: hypothetical protein VH969_30155 [Actinophytocola sp.]|jgi:hypothetical protein|uniref:hypothetical protein n=1 Tax=Actinophytocola sp. TaxID=1872138 RepID=UPI002F947675